MNLKYEGSPSLTRGFDSLHPLQFPHQLLTTLRCSGNNTFTGVSLCHGCFLCLISSSLLPSLCESRLASAPVVITPAGVVAPLHSAGLPIHRPGEGTQS